MYENEDVDENEAKELANELNAIFQKTSAKESHGVDDLFIKIGKKFLDPNSETSTAGQGGNTNKPGDKKYKKSVKLNEAEQEMKRLSINLNLLKKEANNKNIKLVGKNAGKQKGKCC